MPVQNAEIAAMSIRPPSFSKLAEKTSFVCAPIAVLRASLRAYPRRLARC